MPEPAYHAEPTCAHARDYEVIIHDGPLPPLEQQELSEAEQSFREALEDAGSSKSRYAQWAAKKRTEWMSARGIKVRT